jgi:hypothetical protein
MLIMLAESRSLRRKLVRHPADAGLDHRHQINLAFPWAPIGLRRVEELFRRA